MEKMKVATVARVGLSTGEENGGMVRPGEKVVVPEGFPDNVVLDSWSRGHFVTPELNPGVTEEFQVWPEPTKAMAIVQWFEMEFE